MTVEAARRILGLVTGVALVGAGAIELAISRMDLESSKAQAFCRVGLCAGQFSPERVFAMGQKAALGDPSGQLADFQRAVQLSPASAYRWADLGEAEFNVRDFLHAEYAFSQALQAGPRSPVILMRAANLYFQIGDSQSAVRPLMRLLEDPSLSNYYETAFLTYSRLGLPVDEILGQGVPQRKDVLSRLLLFWTQVGKADEAVATWKWASRRGLADEPSMGGFFNFLMKSGRQQEAQELWQTYAKSFEPGYRTTNWIYNPGFAREPLASPFDWKIDPCQDVDTARVQDPHYEGGWALRLRFNGAANTAYYQTFQDLVLAPGSYQFRVLMKAEQVTSDEGVRIHIYDLPTQLKLNVWTDTLTGTRDWTNISKEFEVPTGIKTVRVEVARSRSRMFDNKIGGTILLDGMNLKPD